MNCFYGIPTHFQCPNELDIIKQIKELALNKFGFDLESYDDLMYSANGNLSLQSFGQGIMYENTPNTVFEIKFALQIRNSLFLFSDWGMQKEVNKEIALPIIMKLMEERNARLEKDLWRNRWIELGVKVEW